MEILRTIEDLKTWKQAEKFSQLVFIPTMGALHKGHISLVNTAQEKIKSGEEIGKKSEENIRILVSVFVNPTQFEDVNDLEQYPALQKSQQDLDLKILEKEGVDAVFVPEYSEIYAENFFLKKSEIFLPEIFSELEGKEREGHFEGVFQVVHRLFSLINPDSAIFGQKDFQQVFLIKYLQKKYFPRLEIITAPVFREISGLAYSSRNMRFSPEEKTRAVVLYRALLEMQKKFSEDSEISIVDLEKIGRKILESEDLVEKIHYCEIRNAQTLEKLDIEKNIEKGDIILISVQFSRIHLIDNWILLGKSAKVH